MEIKLSTTEVENAVKNYVEKLGFSLKDNDINVVVSQTRVATITINEKEEITSKPVTEAASTEESEPKDEIAPLSFNN